MHDWSCFSFITTLLSSLLQILLGFSLQFDITGFGILKKNIILALKSWNLRRKSLACKIQKQMSKSVFFIIPIAYWSRFGRIPTRSEWFDSLKLALNVVTAFAQYIFLNFVHPCLQSTLTKFSKSTPAEVVYSNQV